MRTQEQGADVLEQGQLLLDAVAALPCEVHEVQHAGLEVGQGRDGLHLDGVALLERVVQDPGDTGRWAVGRSPSLVNLCSIKITPKTSHLPSHYSRVQNKSLKIWHTNTNKYIYNTHKYMNI